MQGILFATIIWGYVLVGSILIILTATRKKLRGKGWLIAFLGTGVACSLTTRIVDILRRCDLGVSMSAFREFWGLPLFLFGFIGYCLLVPYVLAVGHKDSPITTDPVEVPVGKQATIAGWLVFPGIGLILGPIVTVVSLVVAGSMWAAVLDEGYGDVYALNIVVEVALLSFTIYAASRFFRKRVNAPSVMIALLIIQVVAIALCLAINLSAEADIFVEKGAESLLRSMIGAAIWIPYSKISDRVKRTFVQ